MDLLKIIVKPISVENIAGTYDPESKNRDYLEGEVMKIGTLYHADLDWGTLEKEAIALLSEECKDFKVLSYLMLCLQQDNNPDRFLLSLQILVKFTIIYWDEGYPEQGERGVALKTKLVALMLNRSIKECQSLKLLLSDMPLLVKYEKVVIALEELVVIYKLKVVRLSSIVETVSEGLVTLEEPVETAIEEVYVPKEAKQPIKEVNFSDERKIKETYLKLAQFTNETDMSSSLGYQLRRFGLWQSISVAPPTGKKGNTEIMAVSEDRILEYKKAIKDEPTVELLSRIEHTVETSPFWLQGSSLAFDCAVNMGMLDVSKAILESTIVFLKNIPELSESRFSDGTPFVDAGTLSWLRSKSAQSVEDFSDNNLNQVYDSQGLEAVLSKIDELLGLSKDQRETCYLNLMAAEFLRDSGMKSLAQVQFSALQEKIKEMQVGDWEPSFLQRLSIA